jgi:hypothetical protein
LPVIKARLMIDVAILPNRLIGCGWGFRHP